MCFMYYSSQFYAVQDAPISRFLCMSYCKYIYNLCMSFCSKICSCSIYADPVTCKILLRCIMDQFAYLCLSCITININNNEIQLYTNMHAQNMLSTKYNTSNAHNRPHNIYLTNTHVRTTITKKL